MGDFGDIDDFNDHAVQGKPIKAYRNGHFENPKTLFVQHHWTWDEFLCAASQRLEMVPMASRVFNADGAEIDDIMCIEENDMVFFSTGRSFKAPSSTSNEEGMHVHEDKMAQVVGGYKVSTLLGRGGFGEVRLGIHQLTNDKVALKFILKSEMGSLGDVERTTTEIQCLTALNHPSIIKLLRVINEPNHVVLVIELLEGGDLFHYLKNSPPGGLPESEGAPLFLQILSGVGFAHNQHICHRDLKLENILLSNKNDISNVKIADFGLSDFYKPGAMMKTSCGSISYLAPEVFRGTSNAGPPLDVWSLGVILFAIVCGRLPFEGTDLHGTNRPRENVIRNRILRCQYKVEDHLSPALVDLITQLLKPDPNERATIPEIFSHPWVRGNTNGSFSSDMALYAARDDQVEDVENEEDLDFAITYSPKSPVPAPGTPGAPNTPSTDEEKLPSIVQRSPSRLESFSGAVHASLAATAPGGNASIVPTGTPTGGRGRPTRIADMPLHTKQSSAKLDKSPRPSIITTTVPIVPNGTTTKPSGSSLSPQHASLKRTPSSLTNGSTRSRQRGTIGSDKTHVERAPVHAGDGEKLPVAHQKSSTRRRSEHVGGEGEHVEHSLAHQKASSYGAEMTGKRFNSGALHLPGAE